ncbi:hypothetical protein RGQ21_78430 [Kitasatospora aureofaciens]|nr:hypothetical protein RGQ21_78430 [Kitasatospora aureofaciens]
MLQISASLQKGGPPKSGTMTSVKGANNAVDMDENAAPSGTVTFVPQIAAREETKATPARRLRPDPAEARKGGRVLRVQPESVLCASPSLPG